MGEVLRSHLGMPWVGSMWRRYAFQIFVGGVGFYIASIFPGHPLLIISLTCFAGMFLAEFYLFRLSFFSPYPTKLNFLERHTTNLWERI